MHLGTDVATPMYTPLYAIGPVGGTVNVRCWDNGRWGWVASYSVTEWSVSFDYVHLPVGECKSGLQKVGTVIAKSVDSKQCRFLRITKYGFLQCQLLLIMVSNSGNYYKLSWVFLTSATKEKAP
ncbi:hypothetical protein [Microcoleus sp. B7-D4]|uniref:hypothetical protein n=1 Tax=Microcoleus sp. B7-D4 TaxID=2818696 RepID=UPI002FD132E6